MLYLQNGSQALLVVGQIHNLSGSEFTSGFIKVVTNPFGVRVQVLENGKMPNFSSRVFGFGLHRPTTTIQALHSHILRCSFHSY